MASSIAQKKFITTIMPKTRGKLKPDDEYRLIANYSTLIQAVDAQFLAAELFSQFVLDADDKERILSKTSKRERNQLLLDILLDSGPGESYSKFVEALTVLYPEVADKLEETVVKESVKPCYSWYENLPAEVKNRVITDADASRISSSIGGDWEHVMARLGVSKIEVQHELSSHPYASISNIITSLLIRWKQRYFKQATVDKLVSVLKEVDESDICTIGWDNIEKALKKSLP